MNKIVKRIGCFILFALLNIQLIISVSYELDFEEPVANGEEFEITVRVSDLEEEKYDAKLWIEKDGKIISDRFDPDKDEWKSSFYYINEYFQGEEDERREIKLRIDEEYEDFEGEAIINFRLRGEEVISEEIEIVIDKEEDEEKGLEEEDKNTEENDEEKRYEEDNKEGEILEETIKSNEIIRLNDYVKETEDIKTNEIIYESDTRKIVSYAVYGFVLLCIILCILIIWGKLE